MIHTKGLHKRKTYDEQIDYLLHGQEKIKYPNRLATQILQEVQEEFNETYQRNNLTRKMKVKAIQTNPNGEQNMVVNLNGFREDYMDKLYSGKWHLRGGVSREI